MHFLTFFSDGCSVINGLRLRYFRNEVTDVMETEVYEADCVIIHCQHSYDLVRALQGTTLYMLFHEKKQGY